MRVTNEEYILISISSVATTALEIFAFVLEEHNQEKIFACFEFSSRADREQ